MRPVTIGFIIMVFYGKMFRVQVRMLNSYLRHICCLYYIVCIITKMCMSCIWKSSF